MIVTAALIGATGGAARAIVGLLKAVLGKRIIFWKAWFLVLALNAGSGAVLGFALQDFTAAIQLILGYASFDILESIDKYIGVSKVKIPIRVKSMRKSLWREAMRLG